MKAMIVLALCATAAVARAQPMPVPARSAQIIARVTVESELARYRMMAPLTVAPDVAFGLDARWSLLVHTSRAASAQIGAGGGICVRGSRETLGSAPAPCERRVVDPGLSVLARVGHGVAARAGFYVGEPQLGALAGAIAHLARGRWFVTSAPTLVLGVTGRQRANTDRVRVPVYGCHGGVAAALCLRTGIEGALATFDETFAVPVGLSASLSVRRVQLGAEATLDRAFGPLNAMAWRSASFYLQVQR